MRPQSLGVIGLGAVGGSVAWQAALSGVPRVLGFTPRPAEGVAAVRAGAVTDLAPSVRFLVERAELVVVAAPPLETLDLLATVRRFLAPGAFCTDTVAVKSAVTAVARGLGLADRFAGSHPVVALDRGSFHGAEPAAFRRALVYVTPADGGDGAAREIADFWASVYEAEPVIVDAADHDAVVAWTQHLPRTVAAALARACAVDGPRGVTYGAAARELARLAPPDPRTAGDVLLLHREAVLQALDDFEGSLGTLRRLLAQSDRRALEAWLADGLAWRRVQDR